MKLEVVTVDGSNPPRIRFRCGAGTGTAEWRGNEVQPKTTRHVEMDHESPLGWAAEGVLTDGSLEDCRLVGTVEAIEEDDLVVVRLDGGVLLTELIAGSPMPEVNSTVELLNVRLTVSPIDY